MPNTLPPLPPSDENWPPRAPRRLHPETIERLRAILSEYDTGAYELATAIHEITQTVKRDGIPLGTRPSPRPARAHAVSQSWEGLITMGVDDGWHKAQSTPATDAASEAVAGAVARHQPQPSTGRASTSSMTLPP